MSVRLADAGVWAAIADPNERFHAAAHAMVSALEQPLGILDLTLYEVANVVGSKWKKPQEGRSLLRLMEARCEDNIVAADLGLLESAMELAAEHDLTAYDAAYVAAARDHGWTLVSTDVADLVSKGLAVTPDAADYPLDG